MEGGYAIRNQEAMHFLTLTIVDWVDVFSRKIYRDIVIDSLKFCQENKGMNLISYVIMSNHIHIICQSDKGNLSDLVRDFKKYVAQMILNQIKIGPESRSDWMLKRFAFAAKSNQRNSNLQFWQINNHPEEIFTEPFLWSKINYIHMNPVRAGIVSKASDYLYSSASNYMQKESLIPVTLPSNPIINPLKKSGYDIEIDLW
ncbi:REP-associated tyrosine transposase [Lacihabitans soyangensis]|uniref:Transposase n=1 Tax=Lacihabitans soyangensis TaxID=869394 RepID=A0AAE3H136_9BACT|nr:transposase [Lacihabitans soyangensis]MCP9762702.1 transposase [Lacihabitans soyangensis]